jgi:Holliday junction resolvase RusA-like endonuclease
MLKYTHPQTVDFLMSTVIDLPRAISVNRLWRIMGKRLVKSDEYHSWLNECGWEIKLQRAKPVQGDYRLRIEVLNESRCDLDNIVKAVSDLLQKMQIIENDRLCRGLIMEWVTSGPALRVTVTPLEESKDVLQI